jgi:hypothetical protein
MELVSYDFKLTDNESYVVCEFSGGYKMKVLLWSFYLFLFDKDLGLYKYSEKFIDYESLTTNLLELEFDFGKKLTEYTQQFSEDDIKIFSLYCK